MIGALLGGAAHAAEAFRTIELPLPRAGAGTQALRLKVTAGALPRGALLFVSTDDGEPVGAVSSFEPRRTGLESELPVPKGAARGATIRLRLQMRTPDGTLRAPNNDELLGLSLVYVPVTE